MLWFPLPAAALFTHFSTWILFVLWFSPSQSRKMTSSDCLLPHHSSFSWKLKSWSRCWKLYSPFGLIHWVPAFSWRTGRRIDFVTKILDWLIFAVLQTVVWRLRKLTLNFVELEVVAVQLKGIVLGLKLWLETKVLFIWWQYLQQMPYLFKRRQEQHVLFLLAFWKSLNLVNCGGFGVFSSVTARVCSFFLEDQFRKSLMFSRDNSGMSSCFVFHYCWH